MIKVLHIFGKMDRGGAEMRTLEVMPLLAEKGVRFDFCTLGSSTGPGQLDDRIRELGGEVYPCPLRPGLLSFGGRFTTFLKESNYDIVHSHVHYASGYIVRLAQKASIKGRVVHFRSIADGKPNTFRRKLYRKTMRVLMNRYATGILAVCRGAMEFGWNKDWQTDPRCSVVYNGLDLSVFDQTRSDPKGVRTEFSLPANSTLIINVGRFHRAKGQDVLLNAAAIVLSRNVQTHLLLVGDGKLREEMEVLASTLGVQSNVHFLGVRNDVPRLLKGSDCFALASRREGLPGVVLEAIAAGLPVVASDLPGVREIAEHTNLISIVPLENPQTLADQLFSAISRIDQLKAEAGLFPTEFDLYNCAEKIFEVYTAQIRK